MRPAADEIGSGFSRYLDNVPEDDVLPALEAQLTATRAFLGSIGEEKAGFRYAPGKWSIKQIVGHVADCERVFQYRAAAFARGEQQQLPGFDENVYADHAHHDRLSLAELIDGYAAVRQSSILLYRQLPTGAWDHKGIANKNPLTVRGLAYVTLGHERHHLNVLRERYLK